MEMEDIQQKISFYEDRINILSSSTVQFLLEYCDDKTKEIFKMELDHCIESKNELLFKI